MRLAADHNFDARITEGILRRRSDLEIVHIRDVGLATAVDPIVLSWAASEARVLLTHDRATLLQFAYQRVLDGEPLAGVISVDGQCPIGRAIDDILLWLECIPEEGWANCVYYVPL